MNNSSPDGLDKALTSYFYGQVPNPWPACQALGAGPKAVPATPRSQAGISGRAILAVSAAAMLGLGILLSSDFPATSPTGPAENPGVLKNSTADGKDLLPPLKKVPMGDSDGPLN